MEETKTIQIPKGWVVDKEKSTESSIVLVEAKEVPMRWRDNESQRIDGYFIHSSNSNISSVYNLDNSPWNHNVFAEEKQAKSAIAMARISQIMEHDKRFGGVVTDEMWNSCHINKFCIIKIKDKIGRDCKVLEYHFLAFRNPEQRELFLEENEDLVKDYLMIE